MKFLKPIAAAMLVGGCLTITTVPSSARTNVCGTSIVWCVWVNYARYPHTIGVARGTYGRRHPGWYRLAGVYSNDRSAWRIACRYHRMRKYHSPDIARGRVVCPASIKPGARYKFRLCGKPSAVYSTCLWTRCGTEAGVRRWIRSKRPDLKINRRVRC